MSLLLPYVFFAAIARIEALSVIKLLTRDGSSAVFYYFAFCFNVW